jgi:uncharacterized protein (DUF488 family)
VRALSEAGVRRVVDVRALPASRRKGFSKTPLREALGQDGIEYVHVRSAGNPFRSEPGGSEAILTRYGQYLDARPEILIELEQAIAGGSAALLCLERDVRSCHRGVLIDRLRRRTPELRVTHL